MRIFRTTTFRLVAASAIPLVAGAAICVCPLQTPDWIWALPIALGVVLLIFALGRVERHPSHWGRAPWNSNSR